MHSEKYENRKLQTSRHWTWLKKIKKIQGRTPQMQNIMGDDDDDDDDNDDDNDDDDDDDDDGFWVQPRPKICPTFTTSSCTKCLTLCGLQVFPAPYETRCDSATWTTSSWNVTSYLHQQSWTSNWAWLWWIAGWEFWDNFHSQNANVESEKKLV